jgi:hypothetical protein
MLNIEKTISNFIEQQFPFFLQEEGPMFIEFVKQYYMWMESQQAIYHSRRLPEYRDIDSTTDAFLVYFKEKYLKNIQFNTASSLRLLTKHSLDLYRSKGAPRAVDLLFKVVFDTPAEVYLPGDDLFKLSSGDFYQQKYLEVIPSPYNILYVGKEIIGLQSGATAFIEKLSRKKIKGTYVEVFTISALNGHFITNEYIRTLTQSSITNNPKIIGSLTNVDILSASQNFEVGDTVLIESSQGAGAKGRVSGIAEVTGQVDFQLVDGGFGYSKNANVQVSEKVFRIANVVTDTTISDSYFGDYDVITANQYGVDIYNITGTDGTSLSNYIGEHFFTYYSNGMVRGEAVLQDFNNTTSNTAGQAYVTLLSGNVDCRGASAVNAYYSTGNTISANLGPLGIINFSASANVLGTTANVIINYANSLSFSVGELVYQVDDHNNQVANGVVISSSSVGVSGSIVVTNNNGVFVTTKPMFSNTTSRTADITGITLDVGINNIQGFSYTVSNVSTTSGSANLSIANSVTLFPYMNVSGNNIPSGAYISFITVGSPNNIITITQSATANTTANITFTSAGSQFYSNADSLIYAKTYEGNVYSTGIITNESTGALANFHISNTIGNAETLELNTDYISDYAAVHLNANNYGFKSTLITNVNSVIYDALNFFEYNIGTILNITGINNGEQYNVPPVVKIIEPEIARYHKKDIFVAIQDASALFFNGEIVTQPNTGAKGIIKDSNSSILSLRLINFENDFSNNCPNTTIVGAGSGTTANVSTVTINELSKPMGLNAVVTANVVAAQGSVASIEIIDSGYGFQHREQGTFTSEDGSRVGTLQMLLGSRTETADRNKGREGHSLGYYRSQGGFLSADKKVYDAYYYQDYSYEVRSSVTLDKYEAMLKQLLHVAGTAYFASTITSSAIPVSTVIVPESDKYNFTVDTDQITVDSILYTSDTTYIQGYTG